MDQLPPPPAYDESVVAVVHAQPVATGAVVAGQPVMPVQAQVVAAGMGQPGYVQQVQAYTVPSFVGDPSAPLVVGQAVHMPQVPPAPPIQCQDSRVVPASIPAPEAAGPSRQDKFKLVMKFCYAVACGCLLVVVAAVIALVAGDCDDSKYGVYPACDHGVYRCESQSSQSTSRQDDCLDWQCCEAPPNWALDVLTAFCLFVVGICAFVCLCGRCVKHR